ncbi:MAG: four helix bundle protein, partial [Chitinophagaceae bacterium]|nr:four helix bundle protein [Chitinophagaceae bacterium]
MSSYKNLIAYKKAFELALKIHVITSRFPAEEKYSLTDQIRRSSRSVCTNLSEAENRKKYKDYFVSKLHDCISENGETEVWLDFSLEFKYLAPSEHAELIQLNGEV